MKNILLTGDPGVGKSTLLQKIYSSSPQIFNGIVAKEIRNKDDDRVGFASDTFAGSSEIVFTHKQFNFPTKVADYSVDISALDKIADMLSSELHLADTNRCILLFDEIGWMQTFSEKLKSEIERALDSDVPSIMSIKQDDSVSPWLTKIKQRDDVEIISMSEANRDVALAELNKFIEKHKPSDGVLQKVELSKKYVQEPSRILFKNFELSFQGDHNSYTISRNGNAYTCTCPFYQEQQVCSHILTVKRLLLSR